MLPRIIIDKDIESVNLTTDLTFGEDGEPIFTKGGKLQELYIYDFHTKARLLDCLNQMARGGICNQAIFLRDIFTTENGNIIFSINQDLELFSELQQAFENPNNLSNTRDNPLVIETCKACIDYQIRRCNPIIIRENGRLYVKPINIFP